jgi:AAA ATPase domain
MRIDRIHIENFLSFDTFTWNRLDPTLNVLVGANGVGKTNLFHALRAVRSAVQQLTAPAYLGGPISRPPAVWKWDHVRCRGDDTRNTRIAIDVALTTAAERTLLTTFLAASLFSPQDIQDVVARESQVNADVTVQANWG